MNALPTSLSDLLQRQLDRLHAAAPEALAALRADPAQWQRLERLLIASDYATDRLRADPALLQRLDAAPEALVLAPDDPTSWATRLRRHRHAESVRLIHRDVNGVDTIQDTLAGTSRLAEGCLVAAAAAVDGAMRARHGTPIGGASGAPQALVVYALGKLGGGELNFSSDIDLVFAFAESGQSNGARALDNGDWFQRAGQQLIQLLSEVSAEGMAYRVDMRLRPFGQSGRLAQSFAAMEHYFQREGRDWERYAWIKARPVAGDLAAGARFLATLRPFVYRRYLDFGALEGLREMKQMIEAEVQRRDLEGHLKLGRGGIREIEFIVQLQQMIRGGREPALREPSLFAALARLRECGHIPEPSARALEAAYCFLRRLENRLQMLREEQTHSLPTDPLDRARLACGLGHADWEALERALEQHRGAVMEEFARVFEARGAAPGQGAAAPAPLDPVWIDPEDAAVPQRLAQAGFADAEALAQRLIAFRRLPALATLSARAGGRLDRLMPRLLQAAARSVAPDAAALRALELVQAVLRRSSYLALLDEQPAALARLVDVVARSQWMAERLCAHPLLLDELLDARADAAPPTAEDIDATLARTVLAHPDDDIETRLTALNEFRQSCAFRVARARLVDRQDAPSSARQLAAIAETVLHAVLPMAIGDLARQHGRLARGGVAAIAYGSFGGRELGLGSDLDLVFLYDDADAAAETDGPRPLDAVRYHARVVQKVVALLALATPAGRLYETDLRLRPDGARGLLVSSLASFDAYQRERAWTWEQQALVRARAVAGDAAVQAAFERIRAEVLCRRRERATVCREAREMRLRMRGELDRSRDGQFDLKQGEGGLVDLEFLVQAGVLIAAADAPQIIASTRTPDLIHALASCGFLPEPVAQALGRAHEILLARALACTLDGRARLVAPDAALEDARRDVMDAWRTVLSSP